MSIRRAAGKVYNTVQRFTKWREEREAWIAVGESTIALIGAIIFTRELQDTIQHELGSAAVARPVNLWAIFQGFGEWAIFVLLLISIVARLVVTWRQRNLGLNFRALFAGPKRNAASSSDERLFHELAELVPRDGYLGSPVSTATGTRTSVLDHIARESASQFSIRTYGEADPMWKTWEERYISDWLSQFPATIWRVPPEDPAATEDSGYFSIVVPVTEDAWKKVRYGHLSTALCAIDEPVVAHFSSTGAEPYGQPIFLIVYALIYVPTGLKNETTNRLKLLYCGVEHLAYLLRLFYPAPCDAGVVTMSIVCESPNTSLDKILGTLGFVPVKADFDADPEHAKIRKSVAGFRLFEIGYQQGDPTIGRTRQALRFLDLLCDIGRCEMRAAATSAADGR